MALRKGYQALLDEALATVRTLSLEEAQALHGRADVQFIDLRDPRELEREGRIPGAFHAPRGMLEFWVDPDSPYYKEVFAPGKTFVFYCQSGWRSALATRAVQDMGLPDVCHVGGGYRAWKDAGAPVEPLPERKPG
ncbi:MAG: rhodanese-like domain-containing protein [Gammaproteobacteria bacterium]|jgi:rhodanese-related sulfurtransferase